MWGERLRGVLLTVAVAVLSMGCGVSTEDINRAYLVGYGYTLNSWPCTAFDCGTDESHTWFYYGQLYPEDPDGDGYKRWAMAEVLWEEAAEGCKRPKAADLRKLNRVEAAELGALHACEFAEGLGYDTKCNKVGSWMQEKVTEQFSVFVSMVEDGSNGCEGAVEEWDL